MKQRWQQQGVTPFAALLTLFAALELEPYHNIYAEPDVLQSPADDIRKSTS